jgi:hypothetical protein
MSWSSLKTFEFQRASSFSQVQFTADIRGGLALLVLDGDFFLLFDDVYDSGALCGSKGESGAIIGLL